MPSGPFYSVAVVPIFVNAGTAILPAIIAPVATALALLLKPRQLVRACRKRPAAVGLVLVAVVGVWILVASVRSAPARGRRVANSASAASIDWTRIALDR